MYWNLGILLSVPHSLGRWTALWRPLLLTGLAWAILPAERNLGSLSPFGESWRFFIIICAVPSISSVIFFWFMPESPKFLMRKGKSVEAYNVLKRIYRVNNPRQDYPVSWSYHAADLSCPYEHNSIFLRCFVDAASSCIACNLKLNFRLSNVSTCFKKLYRTDHKSHFYQERTAIFPMVLLLVQRLSISFR